MKSAAAKRQELRYTALPTDDWTNVTEDPSSGDVIVICDVLISSNIGSSLMQFRQYNGSTTSMVWVVATASDRSEQIHWTQPVHLKAGYRLQCAAS